MRNRNYNPDALFQPPRCAAELTGFSVKSIREGCRNGTIPHVMVGKDFRINMSIWLDQLNAQNGKTL